MVNNKNKNNSSNSLVFGRWPQPKISTQQCCVGRNLLNEHRLENEKILFVVPPILQRSISWRASAASNASESPIVQFLMLDASVSFQTLKPSIIDFFLGLEVAGNSVNSDSFDLVARIIKVRFTYIQIRERYNYSNNSIVTNYNSHTFIIEVTVHN